jgi:hypothetical protein
LNLDGKSGRQSFEYAGDKSGMAHLVSAFVGANRWCWDNKPFRRPSPTRNGVAAMSSQCCPNLLELLDLKGATVTIGAIGCERSLAQQAQADYAPCVVKESQPTLHGKVKARMDEAILEEAWPARQSARLSSSRAAVHTLLL